MHAHPARPTTPEDLVETERFLRAHLDNAHFIIWKQPPTIEALDSAIGQLKENRGKHPQGMGLAIISLAGQSPAPEVSGHASRIGRQWGRAITVLVMAQEARGLGAKVNRALMRMQLAFAGGLSMGPKVAAFVDTPEEAVQALAKGMCEAGIWTGHPDELVRAGETLVARCRQVVSNDAAALAS